MGLYQSEAYRAEVGGLLERLGPDWPLRGRTILLTGAAGMIGSTMADAILEGNRRYGYGSRLLAVVRDLGRARERFAGYGEADGLYFIESDVNRLETGDVAALGPVDYIIHAASNTHPVAYASDPVNTVLTNIVGLDRLLRLAAEMKTRRFLFLSSVEVYGENRGDTEKFAEDYCGYIDCNSLRAGYPEGKRAGEALCQAYRRQYGVDFVIARLARVYGPALKRTDTKAMSQFLWNGVRQEPIVLKSEGTQRYSYLYAADAAAGALWVLARGESGEAYNVAGLDSDVTLRALAEMIAAEAGTKVVFQLPDAVETAGFSKATLALLATDKLSRIGFDPQVDMPTGIRRTLRILREA